MGGRTKEKGSDSDKCQSRSKCKRNGKMRCFCYKEYGHMRRDCLERVDRNKGNSPSIMLAKEYEECLKVKFLLVVF